MIRMFTIALLSATFLGCAASAQMPETQHETTRFGFVRDFLRLGPIEYGIDEGDPMQTHPINYDLLAEAGLTDPTLEEFAPDEWSLTPSAGDGAAGLTWTPFHPGVDRIALEQDDDYVVNYFVAYLWCPREIDGGAIYVGSDDFIQVIVNGETVHVYKAERRGLLPGDEITGVHFRAGWNVLNLKVVDVSHGYEFFCCLVDENGTPMADYPITLDRPAELELVDEQTALASRARAHELGQERIPPEVATFNAAEAAGADFPVEVTFDHDAQIGGFFADEGAPVAYATVGDEPITVDVTLRSTGEASAQSMRILAQLVARDQRQFPDDPDRILLDRVIETQDVNADLGERAFATRPFTVPTDRIGYYAIEVSLFEGTRRVKYLDYPFAIVSGPDFEPERFDQPLPEAAAEDWQEGDFARWADTAESEPVTRALKFWPVVDYPTEELQTPVPPNFMARPGSRNLGLGFVTPTPGVSPRAIMQVRRGWIEDTRRYEFEVDGQARVMDYSKSDASLATWVRTDHDRLTLFEGLDAVGLGQPRTLWYRGADGQVARAELGPDQAELSLDEMSAPWLVLSFSGQPGWASVDIPVLVVLQHKPERLTQSESGSTLHFADQAGAVAILPLYGTRILGPDWADDASSVEIAAQADLWARAMRNYPHAGRDYFRVVGDDVQVRIDYDYFSTDDDWGNVAAELPKLAPIPFWVNLAARHPQTVIRFDHADQIARPEQLHTYGPAWGEWGDGSARYTIEGVNHYVREVRTVTDVQTGGALARAYEDLAYTMGDRRSWALSTMFNLGGAGSDLIHFDHHRVLLHHDGGFKFGQHIFENENSMITNITHALAYLPDEQAQRLKAEMMRFMENGMMLPRYLAFNDDRLMYEDVQWFISRFMIGQWSYGHYTGHWQLIRDRWPLIRAEFGSLSKEMHWSSMRSAGSEESNLLYQGAIGYARSAKAVGDLDEHLYGTYYAVRQLAIQQTLWQTLAPDQHQLASWYQWTPFPVDIGDAEAQPRRPALFYWWLMSRPIYDVHDPVAEWHATVISPFSYPYLPAIMRFQTEKNTPLIEYYLSMWAEHWPQWYEGKTGGWGVYFGAPEYFASRGWMVNYLDQSAEAMMALYLQNHWGVRGPRAGGYEFNNRGWMSLPKALTAIIEASGQRRWVRFY